MLKKAKSDEIDSKKRLFNSFDSEKVKKYRKNLALRLK